MEWVRFQLGPRDQRSAVRTAAWILLASAMVVMVSTLAADLSNSARLTSIAVATPLLIFGGLLVWPAFRYQGTVILMAPLLGTAIATVLDLATHDASAGAQVGFCLPVLFAASQLRFLGAGLVTVAAIAADVVVVVRLRSNNGGWIDVVNLSLVLLLMTGLLVMAGRRQDRLVALLESQASLDPLTGLVTRRVLDDAAHRALATPAVHAGTALVLVDIDHFKSINDSYGHPVGDDALVHIAKVLSRNSRPDTVISRLGGDEIAVLLLGCSEAAARRRAHELLRSMQESPLRLPSGADLTMSISIGVAHAPSGRSHLRELYAAADASLYQAKLAGRGRVGQAAVGHPLFVDQVSDSERITDGLLKVRDMPDGVFEGDVGLPGDDRIDHR